MVTIQIMSGTIASTKSLSIFQKLKK